MQGLRAPASRAGLPTSPVGHADVLWGLPGQGGLLTEWAETVPDLTWPESIRTFGRMRRDPQLAAVLKAFFYPVLRSTWVVDPAGCRPQAVNLISADLGLPVLGQKDGPAEAAVPGFSWYEHARLALLSLVYGHMPFEMWFNPKADDGLTHLAGIQEREPHTIAMIDIADDGSIRQVFQNTQQQPLTANRLLWYAHEREGANWAGISLLRPSYTAWVLKHESMRVHATSIRRWGTGVPNVEAPPGATPAQITQAQQLASQMRAGDTAGAGLPNGFKFNLTGISGSVPDAVAFLSWLNTEMVTSCLAQLVDLGMGKSGSRALGESFLDLFLLALQAVADELTAQATFGHPGMPGLARALTELNWGEGEPVPRIVARDVGDQHEVTAEALSGMVTAGALAPDEGLDTFIRKTWGLPARVPVSPPPPGMMLQPGKGGAPPAWWAPPVPIPKTPGGSTGPAETPAADGPPGPQAAAGARRPLTAAEAAAGLDPEGMAGDLDRALNRVLAAWAPVLRDQRDALARQVAAAVDDGQLHQLAGLTAPAGDSAGILSQAMRAAAAQAAQRMCAEAAAQGVTIDPATVRIDQARLRQVAEARAAIAGQHLASQASRQALHVVAATAGTDAAAEVTTTLKQLSPRPLADELTAALHAAQNMGRIAAAQRGLDMGYDATFRATEILDGNTCRPCEDIDGAEFPTMQAAQAAYPAGGYAGCQGRERCRGTIIASWGPGQLAVSYPAPQAAQWVPGEHPRDARGHFISVPHVGPARRPGPGQPGEVPRPDDLALHPRYAGMRHEEIAASISRAEVQVQIAHATEQIRAEQHAEMVKVLGQMRSAHDQFIHEEHAKAETVEHHKSLNRLLHHMLALLAAGVLAFIESHLDVGPLIDALSAFGPMILQEVADYIRKV